MIRMTLTEAASTIDARLTGADAAFAGCSTDSRTLAAGELFIALQGPHFDGHEFVAQAQAQGAAAVMLGRQVGSDLPGLLVGDTRRAMGELAGAWRRRFDLPVIGITGSNGKTTVKEMLAAILGRAGEVLATRGNLNNDIGVPLTLFRLQAEHRYAVVEMGANRPGEIGQLAQMAQPTIGVVTLCAPAHLEGFGTVANVAREKGALLAGLAADGTAIINIDEEHAGLWRDLAGGRKILTFGMTAQADVHAVGIVMHELSGSDFTLHAPDGEAGVSLALPGRHNIQNALAAAAAASAAGLPARQIADGLSAMQPVPGRLQVSRTASGATVIDDTYNANPGSLQAALKVLAMADGARWLVLGDMGELGAFAEQAHADAGRQARAAGVNRLFAIGPMSRYACEAFGGAALHFGGLDELLRALQADIGAETTILVKGSRMMQMDRIAGALSGRA